MPVDAFTIMLLILVFYDFADRLPLFFSARSGFNIYRPPNRLCKALLVVSIPTLVETRTGQLV